LEETARVLEELITQLDASGLTDGRPRGSMWDFQRDGLLPFERESIPEEQRIPVNEAMLSELEPHLVQAEAIASADTGQTEPIDDEGWSPLPPPSDEAPDNLPQTESVATSEPMTSLDDERARLEAELARLDAERSHRIAHTPAPATAGADSALADLESRLSDVEF
jgi:hypothetical protein